MFKSLESLFLKSASLRQCSQCWNGPCEIFLNVFDLGYKLPFVGAPETVFCLRLHGPLAL